MSAPEGAPLRSDPYQELDSTAATAVSDSARALSPTSDREKIEPISKMRRRWQLTSTKAPPTALLPMEDSPGSSGAASSWHMVAPIPAPHFDVESISDGEDPLAATFCSAEDTSMPAPPARSFLRPTPKPKAWQRPPVSSVQLPLSGGSAGAQASCQASWFVPSVQGSDTLGPAVPSAAGKSLLECRGHSHPFIFQSSGLRKVPQSEYFRAARIHFAMPLLCSIVWNLQVLWLPRRSLSEPHAPWSRRQVFRVPRIFMTT